MTPNDKTKLETEIYLEIHKYNGSISDAADFLRHKDSSRISRLVNPNDSRANNIFGEFVDVLQGFHYRHPKLARFIWEKINVAVNSFMGASESEARLAEIRELSFATTHEQIEVNQALSSGKSQADLEIEAFQALQHSQKQYDAIVNLRTVRTDYIDRQEIDYRN